MKKLILFFMLIFSGISHSALVYTTIDKMIPPSVSQTSWKASGTFEWDPTDTTENLCWKGGVSWATVTSCDLQLVYSDVNNPDKRLDVIAFMITDPCLINYKTWGEVASKCLHLITYPRLPGGGSFVLGAKGSFTNVSLYNSSVPEMVCARFYFRVTTKEYGSASYLPIPNQMCGLPPPPIGACLTPDAINFDHGTVNTDLNNTKLSQAFTIECNIDISVSISVPMLDKGNLTLGNNLYSSLRINGKYADDTARYNLKKGLNQFEMTSELGKKGVVSGGDYSGQSVMILYIN